MTERNLKFSVSREDLAFNFAAVLADVFSFSVFVSDAPTPLDGVRQSEHLGYDFQNECSPFVRILPFSPELTDTIGANTSDLTVNIFVEDIGLSIRKLLFSIPVSEITQELRKEIDLKSHQDLSFSRGFEIKCLVSRSANVASDSNLIWHKSQVIHQKSFIVKAALDEALFEITWVDFSDEDDRQNLLCFVDWTSSEVSTAVDKDCFQVKANRSLKEQFKRLENNSHFGGFCIRMIAEQILSELLQQTLRFATVDDTFEPQMDSLHEKFKGLLKKHGYDFDELAHMIQSSNKIENMNGASDVKKIFQKMNRIGATLEVVKFGGYR
jgi:hypothetical protein